MKLKALLILVLILAATRAFSQSWTEVQNTKIGATCTTTGAPQPPTCIALNYPQSRNVIAAWGGGVMDTTRNRLIIWGGGHGDYSGNELYAVDFDGTATPLRLTNNTNPSGCGLYSCDGGVTPNSRHTYHNMAYVPTADVLLIFGGGLSGPGTAPSNDLWAFSFATNTWQYLNPISSGTIPPPDWQMYMDYDPVDDRVLFQNQYNLYSYKFSTKTWTTLRTTGGGIAYPFGSIDPVRRKLYVVDQAIAQNNYWYDLTGADNYARHGPFNLTTPINLNGGYPGMVHDPVSGDIIVWKTGDTVYRWNTSTNVVTPISGLSGGPGAAQVNGTNGRWNYSQTLNAFVLVNSFDQNAYTFRLSGVGPPPPDTQAPTVPAGLTASPVLSTQINLAWTASADNVGVTEYRIERCIGSGCSNFAQIGVTPTTSHADANLTANTLYRYRVRAADAAPNLSGYSTITDATTPPISPTSGTITVGVGKNYATICAAVAVAATGSIIAIDAGVYPNEACQINQALLTLRGIGGTAHMKWNTGDHQTATSNIPNGKGLLIVNGTDIFIENMEFSGAQVSDANGAGIRYQTGNLTVLGSYFHDNENGLLGQGGLTNTLTIKNSTFERNGQCVSGFCAHNIYVGSMGKLVFHSNRSLDPREGHALKSRAYVNEILANTFSTKNSNGSYEVEFPNGGTVHLYGNVIEQGANTGNSSMVGWGLEGATNPNPELEVRDNTFINLRTSGANFIQTSGYPRMGISNNTYTGGVGGAAVTVK
jgi:chitodextrinase